MGLLFEMMRYEGGSMDNYCSNIVTTSRKLARLGVKFDDEIIFGILLHGLSDKFQTIIHAWDVVSDNLKLDEVISKLKNTWPGITTNGIKYSGQKVFRMRKIWTLQERLQSSEEGALSKEEREWISQEG